MTIRGVFGILVTAFVAVVILTIAFGSWFTVDQGERTVVLRNGAFSYVAEPGLNFKFPWIDAARDFSVQTHNIRFGCKDCNETPDSFMTYSRDQQPTSVLLSVNYRIPVDRVADVYSRYGSEDNMNSRLVQPRVAEFFKNVFGQFNAATAVQERARLNHEVLVALQESMKNSNEPIVIESVQVENIDFSGGYETSIEKRMEAEVEVQRLEQNAKKAKVEAQITVTEAQAKADAVVAAAKAQGEAVRIAGEAEASAIDAKGRALRDNPALVELVKAEKWNGALPTTMVPDGTLPFMNVQKPPLGQ